MDIHESHDIVEAQGTVLCKKCGGCACCGEASTLTNACKKAV